MGYWDTEGPMIRLIEGQGLWWGLCGSDSYADPTTRLCASSGSGEV